MCLWSRNYWEKKIVTPLRRKALKLVTVLIPIFCLIENDKHFFDVLLLYYLLPYKKWAG